MNTQHLSRVVNLLDHGRNQLLNMDGAEAERRVLSGLPEAVAGIHGQFAILAFESKTVRMARSIGRPMRYFLAKLVDGPCLIVAERMRDIRVCLENMGIANQFHPSYTRMVPAHYVVTIELVGCPDPNPIYERFFEPERNSLTPDLDSIGQQYIGQLAHACDRWLDRVPNNEPIGVLFSGGIDSGAVLLTLYHRLLRRGESPARLKAFTLRVDQRSDDAVQAYEFVRQCGVEMLWEVIDWPSTRLDWRETVRVIEDYKPLDVQSGTMALAICKGIRERYPGWRYLVDGDGGDENLKDYPIEENPELTIRSVLNNLMLYQEGWGVPSIKHSLTFSGGQSRAHVRTSAPAAALGFEGFSPFALPQVIEIAEGIPFIELTNWDHQKLYALKGEIVQRGVLATTGMRMPIFEKRRFQHGAVEREQFDRLFPSDSAEYRVEFQRLWN